MNQGQHMWEYRGQQRPPFAEEPLEGQESVWDYPRPPIVVACDRMVVVKTRNIEIARTRAAYRVLETASPPTFYLPPSDVNSKMLAPVQGRSVCEWKGVATFWALAVSPERRVAWAYANPTPNYGILKDYMSFYPGKVECFVDGQRVRPQSGGFYGGWITDHITGPCKGAPGTEQW